MPAIPTSVPDRQPTPVSPHFVPNVMLAKTNERTSVRAFFPRLYDSTNRSHAHLSLDQDRLSQWYNLGVRPALLQLIPECSGDFPPTYTAEMFRAQSARRALSLTTKPIPAWGIQLFAESIRANLVTNNVHWAEDLIFQVQVRGLKTATGHTCNLNAASTALNLFLRDFTITDEDQVFVDVGLEFSHPNRALLWRTDSHFHLLDYLLPDQSVNFITKQVRFDNPNYTRDMSSHVMELTGFRSVRIPLTQFKFPRLFQSQYLRSRSSPQCCRGQIYPSIHH